MNRKSGGKKKKRRRIESDEWGVEGSGADFLGKILGWCLFEIFLDLNLRLGLIGIL